MTKNERELMKIIEIAIKYKLVCLNWKNEDIGFWIDGIIFKLSADHSKEIFDELYELRDEFLEMDGE